MPLWAAAKLLLLASLVGIPIACWEESTWPEFRGKDFFLCSALHDGLAERRTVNRDGNFRLHDDRYSHEALFRLRRRAWRWGGMMIPSPCATTEESLRAVPGVLRKALWHWERASGKLC